MRTSIRNKAILAVITGNTIFGFSFLFSKVALQITAPGVMILGSVYISGRTGADDDDETSDQTGI